MSVQSQNVTDSTFSIVANWSLQKTTSGFLASTQGPDGPSFSQAGIDLTQYTQAFAQFYTLASGQSQDFNFWQFTDLIGNSGVGFQNSGLMAISVQTTAGAVNYKPVSLSGVPAPLFLNASGVITLPPGAAFGYGLNVSGPGFPVTSGAAAVNLLNVSGGTAQGYLVAFGG